MKLLIIGNGPAAVNALKAIAANQKDNSHLVTLVSHENSPAYSPMFLSDYLSGNLQEKDLFIEEIVDLDVEKKLGQKLVGIDGLQRKVLTDSGEELEYDNLLIASGASPLKLPIPGMDKSDVYYFNRISDVQGLYRALKTAEGVIVIGAGAIGIEVAMVLNKIGKSVVVMDMQARILPEMLEETLSQYFQGILEAKGIRFLLGYPVEEIIGNESAEGVMSQNRMIQGDLIIMATGIKPNIDFIESSGIVVNKGIVVNDKMQTNIPSIFAAGDVAESIDPYGESELVFNYYNAIDQGWVAGCNMIGVKRSLCLSPILSVIKGSNPVVCSIGRCYHSIEYEIIRNDDIRKGILERFYINNNVIYCYQSIGIQNKLGLIYNYIKCRKDIGHIRDKLLTAFETEYSMPYIFANFQGHYLQAYLSEGS